MAGRVLTPVPGSRPQERAPSRCHVCTVISTGGWWHGRRGPGAVANGRGVIRAASGPASGLGGGLCQRTTSTAETSPGHFLPGRKDPGRLGACPPHGGAGRRRSDRTDKRHSAPGSTGGAVLSRFHFSGSMAPRTVAPFFFAVMHLGQSCNVFEKDARGGGRW